MDGYFNNSGMGIYTAGNQFDLDPIMLKSIGFTAEEIQALQFIVTNEGKATVNIMTQAYGLPYEQAQKLKYMYDICTGRVIISSEEDLSKHLRKMFGKHQRIGIQNLATSKISDVPRTALIAGIPENTPFKLWNSKQYAVNERMYTVVDVSGQNVIIETNRIPQLKYKQPKYIPEVLEIKEGPTNGKLRVAINKKYCRLCNRFVIVASLRRPEFHHGLIEIICVEGTKVYVFADTMAAKKYTRYASNNQRIYDFGYYPFEIQPKLMQCTTEIYQRLCGVYATTVPANTDFIIMAPEEDDKQEDELEVD